jgi:hypothetical protein
MSTSLCIPTEHQLSRRAWLGATSGALALGGFNGLFSAQAAQALRASDKQVLFVWLDGGISQLESWDPKPNTVFGGPFRSIPTTVKGVHFSELMPRCAKQMHRLCVVRSMATKDNAHSSGVARIQRGDPKNRGVPYPFFGSAVAHFLGATPSNLPPYVVIKEGSGGFRADDAGFLGPTYGSLAFGDGKPPEDLLRNPQITESEDAARNELRALLNRSYQTKHRRAFTEASTVAFDSATELMKRSDIFDTSRIAESALDRYGRTEIGRHMLIGRNMLEAGVRFVKVASFGWDTHGDNFNAHACLVPKFDQAFSAILEDLAASGLLQRTLVIAMSEFGRTPRINGHGGRDHWPEAWSIAMAGCGIRPGVVVGETDPLGVDIKESPYDIGSVFHTWYRALGIDSHSLEYRHNNQPLPLAHEEMYPIKEALT